MASLRSINQDDLRNHNLSVVLDSLLRATEPMSRADLAKKTGLTKAAMSVLVSLMLDNEILVEGAPSGQSLYGRPSIPLEIKGGRLCGMGLQANTDGYGVVVLDLDGSVVGEQWVDFRPSRRTGFAAGRSACQERLCACRYRFGIAGSRHR